MRHEEMHEEWIARHMADDARKYDMLPKRKKRVSFLSTLLLSLSLSFRILLLLKENFYREARRVDGDLLFFFFG